MCTPKKYFTTNQRNCFKVPTYFSYLSNSMAYQLGFANLAQAVSVTNLA